MMDREALRRRIVMIRRQLNKRKINCLLLTKPTNVTYVTGFMGGDSWAVIAKGRVYLLTDSRYTEQAQGECPHCTIIERTAPLPEALAKLVKGLKSIRTITVEASTSLDDFGLLKKEYHGLPARDTTAKMAVVQSANIIETLRSIKDNTEVAAIKVAASIAAKAFKQTLPHIKPGITENQLAGMLDFQVRKLGATSSFEAIIAFGPNASRPHHQPTTRKLKNKDTILMDFGAKYKGYCSDITRCFAIGQTSDFYRKVCDVVKQAQAAAIKMVKAGIEMVRVDAAARDTIRKTDLPVYGHGTGHGFGLEIHEIPYLKPESKGKLEAGQIITIEPGIYIPGKVGARTEDDILVTENGCEILTSNCPHPQLLGRAKN